MMVVSRAESDAHVGVHMNITPIGSGNAKPLEPERSSTSSKKASAPHTDMSARTQDMAKTDSLATDIGTRMDELRVEGSVREERVEDAKEEMRDGTLTSRENLEQAAEGILLGEDASAVADE